MQNKNTSKNGNMSEKDPCLFCLYRWECAKEKERKVNNENSIKCNRTQNGICTGIL